MMMKGRAKKFFALSLCLCMMIGGTVYAEGDSQERTGIAAASEQSVVLADNSAGEVAISEANFPDKKFREVVKGYDTDKNESLSESEIAEVTQIFISDTGVSDLTGIGYFTALRELYCGGNQLTRLDVSKNAKLRLLSCGGNQLDSLDVSKNVELEVLDCGWNQFTRLDVSQNVALKELYCSVNQLTSLDVSQNVALEKLGCDANQLTDLDVSKNAKLRLLSCGGNQLDSLDVGQNAVLEELYCVENQLTNLDVSKNVRLKVLNCDWNQLTSLDVSQNAALEELRCDSIFNLKDIMYNSETVTRLVYGSKEISLPIYSKDGKWVVDLSKEFAADLEKISVDSRFTEIGSLYDSKTGLWTFDARPKLSWFYIQEDRIVSRKVLVRMVDPSENTGDENIGGNQGAVKVDASISATSGVKVDASGISESNKAAICKKFNVASTDAELVVKKAEASQKDKDSLTNYVKGKAAKGKVLAFYEITMDILAGGENKGAVTSDFGTLKLSLYAGKEYAKQKVTVYQLHRENGQEEVIEHKDLIVDADGMVQVEVSKLSTFAVTLQQSAANTANTANTANVGNTAAGAPKTGDSANMALWIALLMLAGGMVASVMARRRTR